MPIDSSVLAAILESLKRPVLLADTGHTIRYMNKAAAAHYKDERLITDSPERRIYMRAVRDADGKLIGYHERYEPKARAVGPAAIREG